MTKFILFLCFSICIVSSAISQSISDFKKGDKMPSLFLNNSETTFHSCSFSKLHKLVYVHFWNASADTIQSNLGDVSQLYDKYVNYTYNNDLKFDVITIAVGKDIVNWKKSLALFKLSKELNYISFDGFYDLYIKNYKISKTPYSLLIDENGSIILANPTIKEVEKHLNSISAENANNVINGRIMTGTKTLTALPYRKIYVTNKQNDTVQTVITNNLGDFTIKNKYAKNELSIKISKYPEITGTDKVFLTTQKGKVVGMFTPTATGFSYQFLIKDVFVLKSIAEEVDPSMVLLEFKNRMFYSEYLFNTNETLLSDTSKYKMDVIIAKLKANVSYKVEIQSHTDITGNPQLNLKLSTERAKNILDYFILKGINKKRIVSIGLGDKSPIIKCDDGNCTPEEIKLNRRTEFKLSKTPAK